jgi:ABC-type multidrug transport system fused ATPase/permease subunit
LSSCFLGASFCAGELVNRLASDSQVVQNAVTVNVSMALRFTGQLLVGFGFLFVISWKLTLVMLSVLPLIIGGGWIYGKYVKKVESSFRDPNLLTFCRPPKIDFSSSARCSSQIGRCGE